MKKILFILFLFLFLFNVKFVQAGQYFEGSLVKAIENTLGYTYWQGTNGKHDGRCIYIFYAPWCPYSQKIANELKIIDRDIEIRWILTSIKDIGTYLFDEEMPNGLFKYMKNKHGIETKDNQTLLKYNRIVSNVLHVTGYPRLFALIDDKVFTSSNLKDFVKLQHRIKPTKYLNPPTKSQIIESISNCKKLDDGFPNKTKYDLPLRLLPDKDAPVAIYFEQNTKYNRAYICQNGNKKWFAIHHFSDFPFFFPLSNINNF